jgi:hypothetical protein
MRCLCTAVLACGLGLPVVASDPPTPGATGFDGSWSVQILNNVDQVNLCLIKVKDKDGKPDVKLVATLPAPGFRGAKLEKARGDARSLHFDLNVGGRLLRVNVYASRAAGKTRKLRGNLELGGQVLPLVLAANDKNEITVADASRPAEGGADLQKSMQEKDAKKQVEGLQAWVEKHPESLAALPVAEALLAAQAKEGASADAVKATADRCLAFAATYGPEMESHTLVPVLKVLGTALRKAGKKDEYKQVADRLARAEKKLDEEFVKTAVPFEVKPFTGRKDKSDRVVLVELFTGAQCPPCVSADIAFDAALKAYKPNEVALLQYHLHIPGPDPLTNADTEARQAYYGSAIQGTPTTFVDGKVTPAPGLGGFKEHGEDRFGKLSKLINEELEKDAGAQLQLKVNRSGDLLDLTCNVEGLKKTGDKVRLRFVLVEEVARYAGRNGQRVHHHVVRSFPGGVEGFALKEKSDKQSAKVSLAELTRSLKGYLDKAEQRRPFLDEERPMDLKHLMVVAFVQDDETKEVLQAAQAEVPGEK